MMADVKVAESAQAADWHIPPDILEELGTIGITELLDQDSRPTFLCDLDPDLGIAMERNTLSPVFCNTSLRSFESLLDIVCGQSTYDALDGSQYKDFRNWIGSVTPFDDSRDIYPSSFLFSDMLWTGCTIRKRWRLISGNRCYQMSSNASDLSSGPKEISGSYITKHLSDRHAVESTALTSHVPTSKSSRTKTSTHSSATKPSSGPFVLGTNHKAAPDWTCEKPQGSLTPHIEFARSIDWAATPLGPMSAWSVEFRQIANLLMASPHPGAVFYGNDLNVVYNQAYMEVVAGNQHPSLMGTGFQGPFRALWDSVSGIFNDCATTGTAVAMVDQMLPMERLGFLEETFFSWSITPLYGGGHKCLGFYNSPWETTQEVINKRRTQTLRRLGEEIGHAKTVSEFWTAVLSGLDENHLDIPFAVMYSVIDHDEGEDESSYSSGSSFASKSCIFEGGLGLTKGHIAAPARLDLKRSQEGFIPSFREAMRTREPTKLQAADGTFPESLIEGIEWRGYGEACREALILPVRPTTGEAVLGFLLLGISPRRPYDEEYVSFINMLNRQLATSLASIILFEDEIRRGQTAAEAAARERELLSDELAMQTNRLKKMTETSPVGLVYLDPSGTIVEANDRWFQMTGKSKEDISEKSWMDMLHETSLPVMNQGWHKLTVEGCPWTDELLLKKPRIDHATGETLEFWILTSYQPEFGPDNSLRSIQGSITDISRIKWAEGLQNRRLEEAEEIRRQQNAFIDLTSHEMRNPLSAIVHCADDISNVLEDYQIWAKTASEADYTPPLEIRNCIDAAQTINLCAQHQKMIIDDILTVSKLDSDLLLIHPSPVQPLSIIQQAIKMFETELQRKDIRIEFNVQDSFRSLEVDWVVLDKNRVLQILINLMTNAIKFTQAETERSITIFVDAFATPPAEDESGFSYIPVKNSKPNFLDVDETGRELYLHFAVKDTGCGLTEPEKKLLFMRFSQASPRTHAQYGGSGLGLFISRQLTELHGGQIGVGSVAGIGSTFAFYIKVQRSSPPLQDIPEVPNSNSIMQLRASSMNELADVLVSKSRSEIPVATRSTTALKGPFDPGQLHILIVEDNLVNQKVLSRQLVKLGCKVSVADHGVEALEFLQKSNLWAGNQGNGDKLSVILMDLEMPVMDGLTCVREIRKLEADSKLSSHVPVIAVTANVRLEQIATAREAGMDEVLSKPFRIPELIDKLKELLDT